MNNLLANFQNGFSVLRGCDCRGLFAAALTFSNKVFVCNNCSYMSTGCAKEIVCKPKLFTRCFLDNQIFRKRRNDKTQKYK
mmetsp:Transcript_1138/g.1624  ORF Transcript_1138/g.1624 Transcript_1138/m.1624 type:complete len:81 (-) Transcript_1138:23-265(-)